VAAGSGRAARGTIDDAPPARRRPHPTERPRGAATAARASRGDGAPAGPRWRAAGFLAAASTVRIGRTFRRRFWRRRWAQRQGRSRSRDRKLLDARAVLRL